MDMKKNGSAYRRIKGFTLVELVVVMAIIAVLAGVMSLATQGFIRSARRESANDNARLLFTGFQNVLTQCEIKQDNSAISPSFANDSTLKNITIEFKVYNGNVQYYQINGSGTTGQYGTSGAGVFKGGMMKYTDASTAGVSNLPNAIAGIIDSSFEGEAKVYIDYENFEVKSVVYKPLTQSEKNTTINAFSNGGLTTKTTTNGLSYLTYLNGKDHEAQFNANSVIYGVYPYFENISVT